MLGQRQRIVIADDHALVRHGLQAMLAMDPGLEVVGEAEDGRQAVNMASTLLPELILMDLSMPGMTGSEAIAEIRRRNLAVRVLVLTVHKAEEYIRESLRAGADGYVLKHSTREELMLAIRSILDGRTYLSPAVADKVVMGYLDGGRTVAAPSPLDSLTIREKEVLRMIAEGLTNKSIAKDLFVSVKTVEKHRSNLMKKLNIHNAASLTAFAIEKGLVMVN